MITGVYPLAVGFERDGVVVNQFNLRPATIGDAIEATAKAPMSDNEVRNRLVLRVYKAAEAMTFDALPELVMDGAALMELADEDIESILIAQEDIAKKRKAALSGLPRSTPLPDDSDSSA